MHPICKIHIMKWWVMVLIEIEGKGKGVCKGECEGKGAGYVSSVVEWTV